MSREDEIAQLLTDLRDGQRQALVQQREHLELARAEAERMRRISEESVALQRTAIERMKRVSRFVVPIIVVLIGLLVWLIVKYRIL